MGYFALLAVILAVSTHQAQASPALLGGIIEKGTPGYVRPAFQAAGLSEPIITVDPPTTCPPNNGFVPPNSPITITYVGFPQGPSYADGCYLNDDQTLPCPGYAGRSAARDGNNIVIQYTVGPQEAKYTFFLVSGPKAADCNPNEAVSKGSIEVVKGACVGNDPIIYGFDGEAFHFNEIGEYVMLESADGYKVHSTFAGAAAVDTNLQLMEKSWTSSVRVLSPNGDMLSCALPAIVPNTSRIQVTAATSSETTMLSANKPSIELAEMSASILLSETGEPKHVVGCILSTPKLEIRVDQVSGYEQALRFPDTEAWAAPFTWLDTSFIVKKPLEGPVTGIVGATYPADKVADKYLLYTQDDPALTVRAEMKGEVPGQGSQRHLLSVQESPFEPIASGIAGLGSQAA
ncbi:hypothetical protein N2152v2_004943 [Parachlorella kessleri]